MIIIVNNKFILDENHPEISFDFSDKEIYKFIIQFITLKQHFIQINN